jgi:hypothetical protein
MNLTNIRTRRPLGVVLGNYIDPTLHDHGRFILLTQLYKTSELLLKVALNTITPTYINCNIQSLRLIFFLYWKLPIYDVLYKLQLKCFIISYVWNDGNMSLFDFLSPVKNSMFTSMIFIYSWIWSYDHWWPTQWPHSVKRLRMCETACWKKVHVMK